MFVSNDGDSISARTVYDSDFSLFYVIPMLLLFIFASGLYAWYYLPQNRGKVWKINQWETYGVKAKSKKKELLFNFSVIFGVVMFIPALLTGYVVNIMGVLLGILFTLTFPAVVIDAIYAAIYIKKHPDSDELA